MPGEGSEPSISACPRFEAWRGLTGTWGGFQGLSAKSQNPMSAALCPAKPPGLDYG